MAKIALITGANRGLGFETARQLGRKGITTIVGARDAAKGEQAAERLRDEGIDAHAVELDVTSGESVRAAAEHIRSEHGTLDILVNNAGILPEAAAETVDPMNVDLFRVTYETNVFGAVTVIREFLPLLRRVRGGPDRQRLHHDGLARRPDRPDVAVLRARRPGLPDVQARAQRHHRGAGEGAGGHADQGQRDLPGLGPDRPRARQPRARARHARGGIRVVVEMATLPDSGPSGHFVDRDGAVPW